MSTTCVITVFVELEQQLCMYVGDCRSIKYLLIFMYEYYRYLLVIFITMLGL